MANHGDADGDSGDDERGRQYQGDGETYIYTHKHTYIYAVFHRRTPSIKEPDEVRTEASFHAKEMALKTRHISKARAPKSRSRCESTKALPQDCLSALHKN